MFNNCHRFICISIINVYNFKSNLTKGNINIRIFKYVVTRLRLIAFVDLVVMDKSYRHFYAYHI